MILVRLSRYGIADVPQHVIQRGNNRCVTFVADEDYVFYLDCLGDAAVRTECAIHAYVLMTNHVHLLVTPRRADGIGRMMQSLGLRYVRTFNHLHGRSGTLWEGRYRATVIDGPQYLLACQRYIETNPIRAGMVALAAEYPWSSHRAHAQGEDAPLLSPHPLYLDLGAIRKPGGWPIAPCLPRGGNDETETSIRTSIRDATQKGWALGSERFKDEIARLTERRIAPAKPRRPRKQ